jgi:hypothetical protein
VKDITGHRDGAVLIINVFSTLTGSMQDWVVQKVRFSLRDCGATLANFYS